LSSPELGLLPLGLLLPFLEPAGECTLRLFIILGEAILALPDPSREFED
jgi:hypothetical protein